MPQRKTSDVMTTGEIARLLRVAPRTVGKWIDSGQIRGWRLPRCRGKEGGDRRALRSDVVAFAATVGIPLEELAKA